MLDIKHTNTYYSKVPLNDRAENTGNLIIPAVYQRTKFFYTNFNGRRVQLYDRSAIPYCDNIQKN